MHLLRVLDRLINSNNISRSNDGAIKHKIPKHRYNLHIHKTNKEITKILVEQLQNNTENYVASSKTMSCFVNQSTIQWNEIMLLPETVADSCFVQFQIHDIRQFGYRQLGQPVYYGNGFIQSVYSGYKWDVYSGDGQSRSNKIGFLSFTAKKNSPEVTSIQQKKQLIAPGSKKISATITIKNLAKVPLRGKADLYNGIRHLKTPTQSPQQGDMSQFRYHIRFNQAFLNLNSPKKSITVSFYNQQDICVGEAIFQNIVKGVPIGSRLFNNEQVRVGDVYFLIQKQIQNEQKSRKKSMQSQRLSNFLQNMSVKKSSLALKTTQQTQSNRPKRSESQKLLRMQQRESTQNHLMMPMLRKRFEQYNKNKQKFNRYSKALQIKDDKVTYLFYGKADLVGNKKLYQFHKYSKYHLPSIFTKH